MKILIAVLILILIGLQFRLWTGTGSFADISRLEDKVDIQTEENVGLQAINDEIYEEVDELKTGLDAIEERARDELGLIKEGEVFYLIVDNEENNKENSTESSTENSIESSINSGQ